MVRESHIGLSLQVWKPVFVLLQQGEVSLHVAAQGVVEGELRCGIKVVFDQQLDHFHPGSERRVA